MITKHWTLINYKNSQVAMILNNYNLRMMSSKHFKWIYNQKLGCKIIFQINLFKHFGHFKIMELMYGKYRTLMESHCFTEHRSKTSRLLSKNLYPSLNSKLNSFQKISNKRWLETGWIKKQKPSNLHVCIMHLIVEI